MAQIDERQAAMRTTRAQTTATRLWMMTEVRAGTSRLHMAHTSPVELCVASEGSVVPPCVFARYPARPACRDLGARS